MTSTPVIPVYTLFGETEQFPDVVHCESLAARAPDHDWRIPPHRHSNITQLFVFIEGRVEAKVDDVALTLNGLEYLFIPARSVHEFRFEPQTDGLVISVLNSVANSIGPDSADMRAALATVFSGPVDPELRTLAEALRRATRSASAFRTQRSVGLAHSVLALIAERRITDDHKPQARLHKLDALIAEHLSDGWAASDYASALAITTGHLSRLCRSASGLGAAAYIEQRVMEEATRLLAFTKLPVSEIGYRLGYGDPSYFSKRFQKAHHSTPSAYRAQFAN